MVEQTGQRISVSEMKVKCVILPEQRVCAFPCRHIPNQRQVSGRARVDQHCALDLSISDEQRISHVSGVESELGMLEQGARSGESVIPGRC